MKRLVLTTTIVAILSLAVSGQSLEKIKGEESKNGTVKRTTWESLFMVPDYTAFFRVSLDNGNKLFDLKLSAKNQDFSIGKDQEITFMFENGESVKLLNTQLTKTCKGCGANGMAGSALQGIQTSYQLSDELALKLKSNKIIAVRVDTNGEFVTDPATEKAYFEYKNREKNSIKIQNAIKLVE